MRLTGRSVAISAMLGLWAVACGDGSTDPTPPAANRPPVVTTAIPTATLTPGDTLRVGLSAHFRDPDGDVLTFSAGTTDEAVASVSVSGGTLTVVAVGRGMASISVTATDPGGLSASRSFPVTVRNRAPVIADSIPAADMHRGDTLRLVLSAHFRDPDGDSLTFSAATTDEAVATVRLSGDTLDVAAVGAGGAVITTTAADPEGLAVSSGFVVTITLKVTSVAVTPESLELTALEEMVRLAATAFEASGETVPGAEFSWASGDNAVATVDPGGVVTATGPGETMIVATAEGVSGSAEVSVAPAVHAIDITPPEVTILSGDTVRLSATATDRNGYPVDGAELRWSSDDPGVATVEPSDPPITALMRGIGEGQVTMIVFAGEEEGRARIIVSGDEDQVVLSKLYEATDGPNWSERTNWLTDAPLDTWYGVETDRQGRVTRLELAGNGLVGPIPPELGSLDRLRTLDLSRNVLDGSIPAELGALSSLERLFLNAAALSGRIPAGLGSLARLRELGLADNRLVGAIPGELSSLSNLQTLSLSGNELTGAIPPQLASASSLQLLYLSNNDLTGPIPPELADLGHLWVLFLDGNRLTGSIPSPLMDGTPLRFFRFHDNGLIEEDALCAPGTSEFTAWLEGMEEASGPFCNAVDVAALETLYELNGGDGWTNRGGWFGGPVLEQWHGVTADSLGRVVALDLSRNGLAGRLHPVLARLEHMRELRIDGNALSGLLPLDLVRLPLTAFHYADTELCAPADPGFQAWLGGLASHEGTDLACDALNDRDVLVAFYHSTGGPMWLDNDKWLTDAPIGEWKGVTVDEEGRVTQLKLDYNNLKGSLPSELASLDRLESLVLAHNGLSGPIPPALGSLARLDQLWLGFNRLTGPIPAELGSLPRLRALNLDNNLLTGPIPAELGSSPELTWVEVSGNDLTGRVPPELASVPTLISLRLGDNRLTGPIPPDWSALPRLVTLDLSGNDLTGPIPHGLGRLATLRELLLGQNDLTGPVPPELGSLGGLTRLMLSANAALTGPLPASLTALRELEELQTENTGLCAPSDAGFEAWLRGVSLRRVASCEGASMVYLTQGAQSREFPVPLVAGREALLRVFVTATRSSEAAMPAVRATFFAGDTEIHVANIPRGAHPIPMEIDESSLSNSANLRIPGRVVQPGLEMAIEVDPHGTLDPSHGVRKRIPASGRIALDVREVPVLDLTLIPFLITSDPDSSIVAIVHEMATDTASADIALVRALLPVREFAVTAHEPVVASTNSHPELLRLTEAIRLMEGRSGHYMGVLAQLPGVPGAGIAFRPGKSSFSYTDPETMAHELGHNLSLGHAPCHSNDGLDSAFPQADGSIGVWGYDFRDGGRLVPPSTMDFMSNCTFVWTSDFSLAKALAFRTTHEAESRASASTAPVQSLLLWGGADPAGQPYLEPAFVVDASTSLPTGGGNFRLEGTDPEGRTLFSLSFDMPEVADGDGGGAFAFTLPVQREWAGALAAITLMGPDGSATLDGESDRAAAILRDPRSGQVRGILRDLSGDGILQAAAAAAAAASGDLESAFGGLDIRVSRGIPPASEWRR